VSREFPRTAAGERCNEFTFKLRPDSGRSVLHAPFSLESRGSLGLAGCASKPGSRENSFVWGVGRTPRTLSCQVFLCQVVCASAGFYFRRWWQTDPRIHSQFALTLATPLTWASASQAAHGACRDCARFEIMHPHFGASSLYPINLCPIKLCSSLSVFLRILKGNLSHEKKLHKFRCQD